MTQSNAKTLKQSLKYRELNLLYLSLDSASLWQSLFTEYKNNVCLCVSVCKSANMCVVFEPLFLSWNKYAQHIYCLYLGKIDGIAGEQNIYHFWLWLIVVLGMAVLQRERGGREEEMKCRMTGGGRGKKKQTNSRGERMRKELLLLRGRKQLSRETSSEISECLLMCLNCVLKGFMNKSWQKAPVIVGKMVTHLP